MSYRDDFGGQMKQRTGWLIPLAVFVVTAALSAIVLAYYLGPSPPELVEEQRAPTDTTTIVALSVAGQRFHIPSNYLPFASTRKGGPLVRVAIEALLPDLEGYTLGEADAFSSNAVDSRVVNILLRAQGNVLPEAERLKHVYLPLVKDVHGTPAEFGLTKYEFRDDTGYHNEELFVGETPSGTMTLRCTRPSARVPSPSCLREMPLAPGISFSYRFKRAWLSQWREIDADLRGVVGSFMDAD